MGNLVPVPSVNPLSLPLPDEIERASFDPTPPPAGEPPARRWWGRPAAELRWQAELARLTMDPVYRGRGVERGNGAPVLLIPGFLAGDASLSVMREWLKRMGYEPHASGIVTNVDCSDRSLDRLEKRLRRLHRRYGRRVALVGHSRGGHFAKALAHRHPDDVSVAISMGAGLDTPFDISIPTKVAVGTFRQLYGLTTDRIARNGCFTDTCRCRYTRDYSSPFPAAVPLTSIYTRGDGVVHWKGCVVPYADCIEVTGSHVGLAFNRKAYRAVATALAAGRERAR